LIYPLLNYCGIRTDILDERMDPVPGGQTSCRPGARFPVHAGLRIVGCEIGVA
jgi:hypothetical protein